MIQFISGTGRAPTRYTLLGTVLLPDLRILKIKTLSHSNRTRKGLKNRNPLYTNKERDRDKIGVKTPFERYDSNNKEPLIAKNWLYKYLR